MEDTRVTYFLVFISGVFSTMSSSSPECSASWIFQSRVSLCERGEKKSLVYLVSSGMNNDDEIISLPARQPI